MCKNRKLQLAWWIWNVFIHPFSRICFPEICTPPPKECWYYKTLEFQAVEGNGYKIIPQCKKSVELFLLIYSNRPYFIWSLLNCWLSNCQRYNAVAVMCHGTFYLYCTLISFDTLLHLWACSLLASDDNENVLFQSFQFFIILK